jgi:phospholipase/carboxylesterase
VGLLRPKDGSGAIVLVPAAREAQARPLLLMLHGAGGTAQSGLSIVRTEAERRNVLVIAPKSASATWDVLRDGFGADVENIDQLLARVFRRYTIDPAKVAVGGFSDGGSYALTLGMLNGDLFKNVLAFSPGFTAATAPIGKPKIYISHGERDTILPFSRTGQSLARQLKTSGYDVRFDVFDGGHKVPTDKVTAAMDWWL